MATYGRSVRRGLPRVAGGEAWPTNGVGSNEFVIPDAVAEAAVAPAGSEVAAEPAVVPEVVAVEGVTSCGVEASKASASAT